MSTTAYILAGIALAWWSWLIWYIYQSKRTFITYNDDTRMFELWHDRECIFEHTFYSRVEMERQRLRL